MADFNESGFQFWVKELHFTIEGLGKLQKFDNWQPVLEEWLNVAQKQSLEKLTKHAQSNIQEYAKHPTGRLASKFGTDIVGNAFPIIEGHVINAAPYALRREYGFSGEDSLGRRYNDLGLYYLSEAFHEDYDWIRTKYKWAVSKALKALKSTEDQ